MFYQYLDFLIPGRKYVFCICNTIELICFNIQSFEMKENSLIKSLGCVMGQYFFLFIFSFSWFSLYFLPVVFILYSMSHFFLHFIYLFLFFHLSP